LDRLRLKTSITAYLADIARLALATALLVAPTLLMPHSIHDSLSKAAFIVLMAAAQAADATNIFPDRPPLWIRRWLFTIVQASWASLIILQLWCRRWLWNKDGVPYRLVDKILYLYGWFTSFVTMSLYCLNLIMLGFNGSPLAQNSNPFVWRIWFHAWPTLTLLHGSALALLPVAAVCGIFSSERGRNVLSIALTLAVLALGAFILGLSVPDA
jgi:hypothetical protein